MFCSIYSPPHRWDSFVANKVAKIQSLLSPQIFYHIPSYDNPAYCLSPGFTPPLIIDQPLWFHGPSETNLNPSQWCNDSFYLYPLTVSQPPESYITIISITSQKKSPGIALANYVLSSTKLLRSLVYMYRFLKKLPPRNHIRRRFKSCWVLRELQVVHFSNGIINLQAGKPNQGTFYLLF